mmetsp:Transcript_2161/g.4969  ORF Transcript_2161/g.4969 Transcript_2161/m.4969 type:complete len:334 (-) Transcript_2161:2523-3524(-)
MISVTCSLTVRCNPYNPERKLFFSSLTFSSPATFLTCLQLDLSNNSSEFGKRTARVALKQRTIALQHPLGGLIAFPEETDLISAFFASRRLSSDGDRDRPTAVPFLSARMTSFSCSLLQPHAPTPRSLGSSHPRTILPPPPPPSPCVPKPRFASRVPLVSRSHSPAGLSQAAQHTSRQLPARAGAPELLLPAPDVMPQQQFQLTTPRPLRALRSCPRDEFRTSSPPLLCPSLHALPPSTALPPRPRAPLPPTRWARILSQLLRCWDARKTQQGQTTREQKSPPPPPPSCSAPCSARTSPDPPAPASSPASLPPSSPSSPSSDTPRSGSAWPSR